jgi:hypothetical protein
MGMGHAGIIMSTKRKGSNELLARAVLLQDKRQSSNGPCDDRNRVLSSEEAHAMRGTDNEVTNETES